jgi:hypothetical protein
MLDMGPTVWCMGYLRDTTNVGYLQPKSPSKEGGTNTLYMDNVVILLNLLLSDMYI